MTRWKAAGIHVLISAAIVAAVATWLLLTWYPLEYWRMARVYKLIGILTAIDVVVGPLLTLIVFKTDIRKLRIDLSIIAAIQLAALIYGLLTMWNSRPVFLVAVPDRFELVFAHEIPAANLAAASKPEWRRLPATGPIVVGAPMPPDPREQEKILFSALEGYDLQTFPQYYADYAAISLTLLSNAQPLTASEHTPEVLAQQLQSWARARDLEPDDLRYVPVSSSRDAAVMVLDAGTGEPLSVVDANPWP